MNKDENDNLYFLFKNMSNSKNDKEMFFEPKINKPNWANGIDWQKAFEDFMEFNPSPSLKQKLQKKKDQLAFDTVKLERRLISLLDAIEELLEYLEDQRQNRSEGNF